MKAVFRPRVVSLLLSAGLCVALLAAGIAQEVPLGNVTGKVTMEENGQPLKKAYVTLVLVMDESGTAKRFRHVLADDQGRFSFRGLPTGIYKVEAHGKAHNGRAQAVAVEEGADATVEI